MGKYEEFLARACMNPESLPYSTALDWDWIVLKFKCNIIVLYRNVEIVFPGAEWVIIDTGVRGLPPTR